MKLSHRDVASLVTVLAVLFGIAAVFPFEAIGFRARPAVPARSFAAFVTLSDAASAAALRAAKSTFAGEVEAGRRQHADIAFGELPAERPQPVLTVDARTRPSAPRLAELDRTAYLPSLAAPPPAKIPVEKASPVPPAFPRQELLQID